MGLGVAASSPTVASGPSRKLHLWGQENRDGLPETSAAAVTEQVWPFTVVFVEPRFLPL